MSYTARKSRNHRVPRKVWLLLFGLVIAMIAGTLLTYNIYNNGLKPLNDNQKTQIFTVKTGSTLNQIADGLQSQHLVRSAWALKLYVHSKELTNKLQAGTYAFSPRQGTKSIVTTLTKGKITTDLVTILPGRRIDQVRADLINDGFTPADVDQALDPAQYADLPVLSYKPASANTLEGLLWPDSFQKDASTSASVIVRESLTEMGQHLTPDIQAAFVAEGLTTYQGLVLASTVLQEVNRPSDQAQAAQVFLARLKTGMMLGSDSTTKYGAIAAGKAPSLNYDSPYNTHLHTGLPPTPISTINASSLAATANPAPTNYLYFVTGDDGTTYFSTNLQDHQAFTEKYCHKLCSE